MKLLKPILTGVGLAFGILGCAILLRCVYLAFWLGDWEYADFMHYASLGKNAVTGEVEFTEYPTGEAAWYTFIPAWCWGLVSLGVAGVCFTAKRLGNKLRRFKPILKKLAIVSAVLVALLLLFFVEENIRGKVALHSYLRQLRAQGEKLTLADFDLPRPPTEGNGATALIALTNQFESLRRSCPFEPSFVVSPIIKLVASGRAVVRWEQPDLGYRLDRSPVGRGNYRMRSDEVSEVVTNTPVVPRASWADLDEQMAKASNTLTEVRTALAQPALSVAVDYSQGLEVKLPHFVAAREAANWLALSSLSHLHHHDLSAATKDIETIVSLTRFQKNEKLLISQLVRERIAGIGLARTWEALQTNGWTEAQLVALQQAWQSVSLIQEILPTIEMDRVFYRTLFEQVRRLPTWNEIRNGSYSCSHFFADVPGSIRAVAWRLAWLDHDELRYLRRHQLLLGHAREAVSQRTWSAFALSDKDFPYAGSFYDRLRYTLSNMGPPYGETAIRHIFQFETQREMTVAAIAIKRYQLRTGELPANLAALVPEYLPQLPHDWMDGQPLRYRPNPDGTFTFYSVGVDGHDDGGDPTPTNYGKRAYTIWDERDAVWPMPASAAEVTQAQLRR